MLDISFSRPDFRRDWAFLAAMALATFLTIFLVQYANNSQWAQDHLMIDGEHIMGTHDAYHWLAGAKGVGHGADTMMSDLAAFGSSVTGASLGNAGFWIPAIACGLVGVAMVLWAWTLGGLEAGLLAGLLAAFAPGYFFRARLGYFDTDIITLLVPLLTSWLVAHWLRPHLAAIDWKGLAGLLGLKLPARNAAKQRQAKTDMAKTDTPKGGKKAARKAKKVASETQTVAAAPADGGFVAGPGMFLWPLASGVFIRLTMHWYGHFGTYAKLVYILGVVLALALAKKERRGPVFWGLAFMGMAAFLGPWGLVAAGAAAGLAAFAPGFSAPFLRRKDVAVVVLVLIVVSTGLVTQGFEGGWRVVSGYVKTTAQDTALNLSKSEAEGEGSPIVYPSIVQSVIEAQDLPLNQVLNKLHLKNWVAIAGLVLFACMVPFRPTLLLVAPLAVLSLWAVKAGARMTMFGGPAVGLGVALPLAWGVRALAPAKPWRSVAVTLVVLALGLSVSWQYFTIYPSLGPTPVLNKDHCRALKELQGVAPEDAVVWTWWDWGYATHYYAERMSFADGARHSGEYVFPLGLALTTPSYLQANQVMRYSASLDFEPWKAWNDMSAETVTNQLRSLGDPPKKDFGETRKSYLVVTYENLGLMPWISFFGSWDMLNKRGTNGNVMRLTRPFQYNADEGWFRFQGDEQKTPLRTVDAVSQKGRDHREYAQTGGAHLILNQDNNQHLLMDTMVYSSMAVQLLLGSPENPGAAGLFRLVYDDFPDVRIYEVL